MLRSRLTLEPRTDVASSWSKEPGTPVEPEDKPSTWAIVLQTKMAPETRLFDSVSFGLRNGTKVLVNWLLDINE